MKKVEAIIKPFKVEVVRSALARAGVENITATEAYGCGRQTGRRAAFRGVEHQLEFLPKVKLELIVDDAVVPVVIETIMGAARTGQIGDGKIVVLPLAAVLHADAGTDGIRTRCRAA